MRGMNERWFVRRKDTVTGVNERWLARRKDAMRDVNERGFNEYAGEFRL